MALEHTPLCELYLVIRPDGTATLADTKLDRYDEATVALIFQAVMDAMVRWAKARGALAIGAVVGDGGPEVVNLKARLYALQGEGR